MNDHTIKIVSIIPYKVLPAKLGGEKGIALFNEYISKLVQLTGITTQNNDPSLAPGYKLLNILSNSRLRYIDIRLYFRIRQILAKEQATHLLIEHPYYGWLAWLLRNSLDLTWVVHSHNIEYMRSRSIGRWWWKALKWYESWAYRKADRVFFISEDDMKHAQNELGVSPLTSQVVTYGIEQPSIPTTIAEKRKLVQSLHGIGDDEKILLFNGALYHSTNYDALSVILEKINPILMEEKKFRYKILICGKGLPDFFNDLRDYANKNIIYAGFVDDVSIYFQAANVFLNPILAGGGVKTKAIEALAMDCSVISTELGALGIKREMCGNKLHVVKEDEWRKFAELIISVSGSDSHTPIEFFEYYFWGNIVKNAVKSLKNDA